MNTLLQRSSTHIYQHIQQFTSNQQDQIIIPADGEAFEELVAKILGLGDGVEAAIDDVLYVELHTTILREVEPLLHDGGELTDPAALLADHVLGAHGADDDLLAHRCHADLDAGVSILG
jgi:hypothetical protein